MMVQSALLDTTRDVDADLCRNIVSLRQTADLFDDLSDGDPQLSRTAAAAEMRVKAALPGGVIARGFLYSTAIEYPFASEPYLRSRYGDGSYGVWYGAIDMDTSIYETAYHMIQDELRIAGLDEDIVRERAVYDVRCRAVLIDVSKKRDSHPDLVAEDYTFTQSLGRRLVNEGHPGLLAPSARRDGTTAAIFNSKVLSNPRVRCYLTYRFSPRYRTVHIERTPGTPYLALRYRDGRLSLV